MFFTEKTADRFSNTLQTMHQPHGLDFLSSMCYYLSVSQFNTFQLEKWAEVHFFI